jgi:hydrogenase-4 membrane subunit HyfE
MDENEKITKVEVVGKVAIENESDKNKKESEIGNFLIDAAKIVLAVFIVDNVVTNKIMSSTEMFIIGALVSFGLFFIGLWFNKRGGR